MRGTVIDNNKSNNNNNNNNDDDDDDDDENGSIVHLSFKVNQNVKVIKGLAMTRLSSVQRKTINPKHIIISIKGNRLRDSDQLTSLVSSVVDVTYPISGQNR